jgi:hypothetical protein
MIRYGVTQISSKTIHIEITYQSKELYKLNGSRVGDFYVYSVDHPELQPGAGILYIRGNNYHLNHSPLVVPIGCIYRVLTTLNLLNEME